MVQSITEEITKILASTTFPDETCLLDRSSPIKVSGKRVAFTIDISDINPQEAEKSRQQVLATIEDVYGELDVNIVLTSSKPQTFRPDNKKEKIHLDGVKKVILVSSGKGGVGKSTITALLAHTLKAAGKRVGILDADIYGPSIPSIFGISKKPALLEKKMIPLEAHGILLNSIGFITEPGASISWRGPMTSKALYQLLSLTKWNHGNKELDYLLIDMPPGTGDIHLSLLENYHIDAALIITTPQKIAGADVERAINLYQKLGLDILGIIENMSYFIDPNTNNKTRIFAGNEGQEISQKLKLDFLCSLPILPELSVSADNAESLDGYQGYIKEVLERILILNSRS